MWLNFVGRDDFFMRDGLRLTGKGAAVLGSLSGLSTMEQVCKLFKLDAQGNLQENSKEYK